MIGLEPLPHREAITYFRSKGYAPQLQRFSYLDHWREDHARNFVVAKGMRDDVLEILRGGVDRALAEGRTLEQFQEEMTPLLQKAGWWGETLMTDPLTGELTEVKLGSPRRLRTIFDTNMRTAHAAGHWARIERTKKAFPYLHYLQIDRPSKRHDHERFHDKIWRVDDPIWRSIYPPNGYFCGCYVVQRTEGWMKRNGRSVSEPIDLEEQAWTNKRTGRVYDVPKGITPGFDANPGATWLDIETRVAEAMPDLSPERQSHERGLLQGLRLRKMAINRETLIIADESGGKYVARDAAPETPDRVSVDSVLPIAEAELENPTRLTLLHSHITDAPLSVADLQTFLSPRVRSVTAISPGGAIWRARIGHEVLTDQVQRFAVKGRDILRAADLPAEERSYITQHALCLYLDRSGVIHYNYSLTDRLRQMMDAHADLIERLIS